MKLERQGAPGRAYSENTRWSKDGVYFVGLSIPGSNNNKVDKPFLDPKHLVTNITRVQTFGETNVHRVRATIDPKSRDVFLFEPMIVRGN